MSPDPTMLSPWTWTRSPPVAPSEPAAATAEHSLGKWPVISG